MICYRSSILSHIVLVAYSRNNTNSNSSSSSSSSSINCCRAWDSVLFSDSIQGGQSWVRFPVEEIFSWPLHTDPEVLYSGYRLFFPQGETAEVLQFAPTPSSTRVDDW